MAPEGDALMNTNIARAKLDTDGADVTDHEIEREVSPLRPGETLRDDFLKPRNLSARALARELGVPANRITEIINGERSITAHTALRLAHYFGGAAEFWMNLQVTYDLEIARRSWPMATRG